MAERRLTRAQINAYADLSHDHNPLHVDEAAAARSPLGGIVAHGFLLLGDALCALGRKPGYPKSLEVQFHAPGRPGDTLTTTVRNDGDLEIAHDGKLLVSGRITAGE